MTYSLLKSFLACILILAFTACNNNDSIKAKIVNSSKNDIEINLKYPKQIIMNIEGMTCAIGCAATIEKNLKTNTDQKYRPPFTPIVFLTFFFREPHVLMNLNTVQGKCIKNRGKMKTKVLCHTILYKCPLHTFKDISLNYTFL